jgi:carbon storage regulator
MPHCDVAVTVISIKGKHVRLGISAPEDVPVHREEVWQKVCQRAQGPRPKG